MKAIRNISIYMLLVFVLVASGCRKYLDVNRNPNITRDATPALLLSSGQMNVAAALGVDLNINGSLWGQYWTQAPNASQYKIFEQYLPNGSDYDREWGLLYNGALTDFQRMEDIATAENQQQYIAVAKLMKAYTFQLITDGWGDVPFSEAVKGAPIDGGILAPKYDPQSSIYDGMIQMVQDALALIDPADPLHPGPDDLVYGGDMDLWTHFANTLLLKMYIRLSEVNPAKAQAGIAALEAAGATYIGAGEDAQITFISTAGNQNPLYSEEVGLNFTQNLVASSTSTDSFISNEDFRRFAFYTPVGADVVGLAQGNFNAPAGTAVSFPTPTTGALARDAASAEAPVRFLTSYESLFLQSEAAARGWSAGDAQALFEEGIGLSFAANADAINGLELVFTDSPTTIVLTPELAFDLYVNGGTITGFLEGEPVDITFAPAYWGQYPVGGTVQEQVRHIVTQKWFSLNGTQGFEAWTEWRRSNYPDFFVISATSIIGNNFPGSFLYPNVEVTRNLNFPGQKQVTTKVWWDAN